MKTVYLESSVISYLTARPSNDLIKSARQAITMDWWENHRDRFEIFVSDLVEEEIGRGNPEAAAKRLDIASKIPNLEISDTAINIAETLRSCLANKSLLWSSRIWPDFSKIFVK